MNGIAFIGFGEAAQAFAGQVPARAYDVKAERRAEAAGRGVESRDSAADALKGARAVLSLVTADQALAVAKDCAASLEPGALWFDMNSVAPDTKREAALAVEAAGGRYVDVAVMSPVHPAQLGVPLLVSGPHAEAGAETLRAIGFSKVRVVPGDVGRASSIKMIRSVMVKGLEALTTECALAADAAGVLDEVIASLNASWPGTDWAEKADYNLDRMMIHGLRRSAEMEEVVKTLDSLGTGAAMTRGTVVRQRAIGELRVEVPEGLEPKISAVTPAKAGVSGGTGQPQEMPAFAGMTDKS
jgi:3-hydroxyisobutyrate dehydrogenase-like beta-hydroxyacid dehydrogenase